MPKRSPIPRAPADQYPDEFRIWYYAEHHEGARLPCRTEGHAINLIYKLNKARAAFRDELGLGIHLWDIFAVTKDKEDPSVVLIRPKQRMDLSQMTDLEGNPVDLEELKGIEPVKLRTGAGPDPMQDFAPHKPTPPVTPRPFHTFDPTKPLIDTEE